MRKLKPHACADCGAPTDNFLCEQCAEICEALTAEGKYYDYRKGQLDTGALPEILEPPKRKKRKSRSRPVRSRVLVF